MNRASRGVARKRSGAERMRLEEREVDQHGGLLDRLEAQIHEAHRVANSHRSLESRTDDYGGEERSGAESERPVSDGARTSS